MEKLVLLSALFVTLLAELCLAAGGHAQQQNAMRKQQKAEDLRSIQELGQLNEVTTCSPVPPQTLKPSDFCEKTCKL
jgi:hypothetical protein